MKHLIRSLTAGLLALITAFSFAQTNEPNDAQIAATVVAANNFDIDMGKLAKSKSKNKEVKEFAQRMITDHTGVNKQATALVKKLKVTPEESDTSRSLKKDGVATLQRLKRLKDDEFDKAYVDHEVSFHQAVLDLIDKTLLPNAKNEELKALVEKVRPAIDAHMQHAKKIQTSLTSSPP